MLDGTLPLLFATVVGFGHAFEADHLVAVSGLVTGRDRVQNALRDGVFWGFGHTATILCVGLIFLFGRTSVPAGLFTYFEACVGLMLIGLGVYRLLPVLGYQQWSDRNSGSNGHRLAFGVGLVHGIAGSGALVILVMTEIEGTARGLLYLLLFGAGSVAGMLTAASVLGLPFAKRFATRPLTRRWLTAFSSALCLGYGVLLVLENLAA